MNAKMDQILADASTMREESVSRLAELESMIAEAEANKTTRDTTIDEVLASSDGYNYVNVEMSMPISYTISDAYPNPFNPTTSIDIALDTDANISVKVFNIMGQLVDVISEGNFAAGTHSVAWDASQISSGVYFVNTEVGSETNVQKIMLVK